MIMIGEKPWVRYLPENNTYGRFVVEPLERGFGSTLGNALRRVLLSSLSGAAVTSIRIEGVSHEFSTIPGIVEDVLQIILNIKEIVFKSHAEGAKIVTLKAKGKGEVKAADIEHDAELEVVNGDKVIANLESGGKLEIEMVVEKGKGYVTSERNKKPTLAVGSIPIDSIFTPVIKVNISTEEVRVGQEINYDRLILDVWTNGSIKPDEAVQDAARILSRHVELFVHLGQKSDVLGIAVPGKEDVAESVLDMTIEDMELSARSYNCVKAAGIKTVGEFIKYSEEELMGLKNFGLKSLNEVRDKLVEYKLSLKTSSAEAEAGEEG
ncbi:MAG: DNA-directed RNA polymerase subunit alpha [Candidatus Saganbacteria bacterium]|nr:DNA-directed RNA polymerase subunit alpha [Candidatus Saganbacteria bacterium]